MNETRDSRYGFLVEIFFNTKNPHHQLTLPNPHQTEVPA